jgi:hypothetical protein
MKRRCTRCGIEKPLEAFAPRKDGTLKRASRCRVCHALGTAELRLRNPAYGEGIRLKAKIRRFGPNANEIYDALRAKQNGCCAVCGKPESAKRNLAIDHDHETGVIRGLLCVSCNTLIGRLEANEKLLPLVLAYLKRSGEN